MSSINTSINTSTDEPRCFTINLDNISYSLDTPFKQLLEKSIDEISFVIFDLETTGGNPHTNGITEIYAIKYKDGKVIDTFYSLVNPKRHISRIVQKITGINNAMLVGQPTIDEVMPKFFNFISDGVLVSHNALSDIRFIEYFVKKILRKNFNNIFLCTHILSTKLFKEADDKTLGGIASYLNIHYGNVHRAKEDASITFEVFKIILDHVKKLGLHTLEDVIKFQGSYGLLSQLQKNIPSEVLNNIPAKCGLIRFYDKDNNLIFITSSFNLKKDLKKLYNSAQVPKKLHKILVKASKITIQVYNSFFNAYLDEWQVNNEKQLSYSSYKWHNRLILGLVLYFDSVANSYFLKYSSILLNTIAAAGPIYSYKQAEEILKNISSKTKLSLYNKHELVVPKHLVWILKDFLLGNKNFLKYYFLFLKKLFFIYYKSKVQIINEQIDFYNNIILTSQNFYNFSSLFTIEGILFVSSETNNLKEVYFVVNSIPINSSIYVDNIENFFKNKNYIQLFKRYLKKYKGKQSILVTKDLHVGLLNIFLWLYYSKQLNKNHDTILIVHKNGVFYEYK